MDNQRQQHVNIKRNKTCRPEPLQIARRGAQPRRRRDLAARGRRRRVTRAAGGFSLGGTTCLTLLVKRGFYSKVAKMQHIQLAVLDK